MKAKQIKVGSSVIYKGFWCSVDEIDADGTLFLVDQEGEDFTADEEEVEFLN